MAALHALPGQSASALPHSAVAFLKAVQVLLPNCQTARLPQPAARASPMLSVVPCLALPCHALLLQLQLLQASVALAGPGAGLAEQAAALAGNHTAAGQRRVVNIIHLWE